MCPASRLGARPEGVTDEVNMSDVPKHAAVATPARTRLSDPASNLERDRVVFLAKDTPPEFLKQLEAIAAGDFAAAGLEVTEDERAD